MPKYLSYPNKKTVPSRLARKQDRRRIWAANKKAKKIEKELKSSNRSDL